MESTLFVSRAPALPVGRETISPTLTSVAKSDWKPPTASLSVPIVIVPLTVNESSRTKSAVKSIPDSVPSM